MKRKLLVAFFVLLAAFACFGLAACTPDGGNNNNNNNNITNEDDDIGGSGHVHNYGFTWKSDDQYHWYECSCGDKKNYSHHTFYGLGCTICKFRIDIHLYDYNLDNGLTITHYRSSGATPEIPYGVTAIGDQTFYDCGIKSVTIPDSVTSIGNYAFYRCDELTSFPIGNNVTEIGENAFMLCNGLTSVTIPNGVKSIGNSAFSDCKGLKSVTIPDSVTSMGNRVFMSCPELVSAEIGSGVESISHDMFYLCKKLESITVDPNNKVYSGIQNCIVEKESKTLVLGCKGSVIPQGVTAIGERAFNNCSELSSIVFPDSVTSIGEVAFNACTGLSALVIPDSVTRIGESAFNYCTGLKTLEIGSGVTNLYFAFSGCVKLESITVDPNNEVYYSEQNCLIDHWQKTLVLGCKTSVIPQDVKSIGSYAFDGCSELESIIIPDSVTDIGTYSFIACTGLRSVEIGSGVRAIHPLAFAGCTGLTSIVIPKDVNSVDWRAFIGCENLTSVVFEDPNDWKMGDIELSAQDLRDPQKAAQYLTETYIEHGWTKPAQ